MADSAAKPAEELTRSAMAVARDWLALPGNERNYYAHAIGMRAAWHRLTLQEQARIQRGRYLRFKKAILIAPGHNADDEDERPTT